MAIVTVYAVAALGINRANYATAAQHTRSAESRIGNTKKVIPFTVLNNLKACRCLIIAFAE